MKQNTHVKIHADLVEPGAKEQIETIEKSLAVVGQIAIMPDCHQGAGCVIGFTGKFGNDLVIPNLIGVDIGCGVVCYPLKNIDIDFKEFDDYVRENIPLGFKRRDMTFYDGMEEYQNICRDLDNYCDEYEIKQKGLSDLASQIGTLGGGNHFIEVAENKKKEKFLLIHSGSRNIGKIIADHFQNRAIDICKAMKVETEKGLEYLPLQFGGYDYMFGMNLCQSFAQLNRKFMVETILRYLNIEYKEEDLIESVHNFVGGDNIIRKGAVQAYKEQKVIIPFNMAEGSILGVGKGNPDYNFSAPHGAGRTTGRKEMMRKLKSGEVTMKDYEDSMKGIFSTSIKECTIDESKFAYKPIDVVMKHIEETVEVTDRLIPVYNLKSD